MTKHDLVYVITGASRGLGLEYVKQLLERGSHVVATARDPTNAQGLQAFAAQHGSKLTLVTLDVSDEASIKAAGEAIKQAFPGGIDVLINNAGISGSYVRSSEHDAAEFKDILMTNVVGPFLVTKALLPLIRKGAKKQIVQISSGLGSIERAAKELREGPNFLSKHQIAYRASKAALNMESVALALDLQEEGITVMSMSPGWVATDMGTSVTGSLKNVPGPKLDAPTSVAGMIKVIDGLTLEESGLHINYEGNIVPW